MVYPFEACSMKIMRGPGQQRQVGAAGCALPAATVAIKTAKKYTRELTGDAVRAVLEGQKCLTLFLELAVSVVEGPFNDVSENLDEFQQCLESAANAVLELRNAPVRKTTATNVIRAPEDMHKLNANQRQARKAVLDAYEFLCVFAKA